MIHRRNAPRFLIRVATVAACSATVAFAVVTPVEAEPKEVRVGRGPDDPVPAGSVALVGSDQLIFYIPTGDGGGSMAIYDGGSPQELLNSFKAKGIVDRAIPTFSLVAHAEVPPPESGESADKGPGPVPNALPTVPDIPEQPQACITSYAYNRGSATYWADDYCSTARKIRWNTNGLVDPKIYFLDHTGNRWLVTVAVDRWNRGCYASNSTASPTCGTDPRVDLVWSGSSSPANCVHVYEASYAGNWWGYTYAVWNASRYFISDAVNIHLNNLAPNNSHLNQQIPCHEIAHVLGIGHPGAIPGGTPPLENGVPARPQTCVGPVDPYTNKNPAYADLQVLRTILYA